MSGIVRLQHDNVFWELDDRAIHQIDCNDIVVIGEYTNADGPFLDDWFLTLVTRDGLWHNIPWYADNIEELTQYLSNKFQQDLHVSSLSGSTEWKSVIRYPMHLSEKALFTFNVSATYKVPKTFFDKILASVGLGNFDTTQIIALTDAVQNELTIANR